MNNDNIVMKYDGVIISPSHMLSSPTEVFTFSEDNNVEFNGITLPKHISKMTLRELSICSEKPMPNIFWRTMQYICFGIKWEEIK